MLDPASTVLADVIARIKTLPEFVEKAFVVYDAETLLGTSADLKYPCLGVVYEGLSGKKDNANTGLMSDMNISIILFAGDKGTELRGREDKSLIVALLDRIRNLFKDTRSPTGHKYTFVLEIPLDVDSKGLGYYQKWKTTAPLF